MTPCVKDVETKRLDERSDARHRDRLGTIRVTARPSVLDRRDRERVAVQLLIAEQFGHLRPEFSNLDRRRRQPNAIQQRFFLASQREDAAADFAVGQQLVLVDGLSRLNGVLDFVVVVRRGLVLVDRFQRDAADSGWPDENG